jgi:hypothetical protein
MVNRIWQNHFGRGLVSTASNFGRLGSRPSHPELLDWLAVEFRESGWDVKKLIRLLVTSATYRQSARTSEGKLNLDPENRLLSRAPRFRMDAEAVRDLALSTSGLLVDTIGGPSVKPYQPEGIWETVAMPSSNTRIYTQDHGEKLYRRSLYTFWKRAAPPPSMEIFNAPTRESCTMRRERTDTPLQALNLLNDPVFFEASQALAFRIMREAGGGFRQRLNHAFAITLAREPSQSEAERLGKFFDETSRRLTADPQTVPALFPNQLEGVPQAEAAAWVELSRVLLNLDEFITRD